MGHETTKDELADGGSERLDGPTSDDVLAILEQAYRGGLDDAEWLEGLLDAARPFLDHGLGIAGFFFDAGDPTAFRMTAPVSRGVDARLVTTSSRMIEE